MNPCERITVLERPKSAEGRFAFEDKFKERCRCFSRSHKEHFVMGSGMVSVLIRWTLKPLLCFLQFLLLVCSIERGFSQVDSVHGVPVEFEFRHVLQPDETGVGLNGTFNNWGVYYNRHPFQMQNVGNNVWKITVPLRPDTARRYTYRGPGFYEYKFVTYRISGNDTSIVGWFPDPMNSRNDPSDYNNSILYVTDPMVYNLQPLNGAIINEKTPTITAKIAVGLESSLDLSSIQLEINGTAVPNSPLYYDSTSHRFTYVVPHPLAPGTYTAKLYVRNNQGFVGSDSTTFTVSNAIVVSPYTFIFDPSSPNLKYLGDSIMSVSVRGPFNNYGADRLTGPDEDGLFKGTELLYIGKKTSYDFILRSISGATAYVMDPDNPSLSYDYSPYVIKTVNPYPTIEAIAPHQGTVLWSPVDSIELVAVITQNDSGTVIEPNSIHVFIDGQEFPHALDSVQNGYKIRSIVTALQEGRHVVLFKGSDVGGNKAKDLYLSFGIFSPNTGYYYVDAEGDDDGAGGYTYPAGVTPHSGDIRGIHIALNHSRDSLEFTVDMGAIDDYTRFVLEITNKVDGDFTNSIPAANLKIPEWNNRGVYMIIAAPNSGQLSGIENTLYISREPLLSGGAVQVNANAKSTSQFRFSLPLSVLEQILGSFTSKWYFCGFVYFGSSTGVMKAIPDKGMNPYVYDVAFFRNTDIQHRLLSNYIGGFDVGAPRIATIGSERRGAEGVSPEQIDAALAGRPTVRLLTDGGDWYADTVRVYGSVSDSTIQNATLRVTNAGISADTTVPVFSGNFSAVLKLRDGTNVITALITKSGVTSASKSVVFDYHADHRTNIVIRYGISQGTVTLSADSSVNPDGLPISFSWEPDSSNPAPVSLSSTYSAVTSFTVPQKFGEYYFKVTAATTKDTSWARAVVLVDSTGAHVPDMSSWHPAWLDSAVVYEIYVRSLSLTGKLNAVTGRLPYLKQLGVNCIWLMPIQPAASPHGYNVTDYYDINPDYGTKADFKRLVETAHRYGIKVVMDLVINHTSAVHPFMKDAYTYKQYSPFYTFYEWNPNGTYKYFFSWWDLPNINYEDAYVRNYLIRMVKYWIENFDIDGYRCDVAWGINDTRPSGPAFWQRFRRELKAIKPDIWLLAEADATNPDYFDKKFDSAYDWQLFNRVKSTISGTSTVTGLDSLVQWYRQSLPSFARPFRFLENHDEARFISVFNLQQTKMAAALLFTIPGVPLIYAGQEVGERTQRDLIDWTDPLHLHDYYQQLAHIRTGNPALTQGGFSRISTTSGDSVYAYLRMAGDNKAIVVHNLFSDSISTVLHIPLDTLVLDTTKPWYANDLLNGTSRSVTGSLLTNFAIRLTPYQSQIIVLGNTPITVVREEQLKPFTYQLFQNYPNPFNPTTTILYEIPKTGKVTLEVYNILGQKVITLVDGVQTAGRYAVRWNGVNEQGLPVASGVYFYRLIVQGGARGEFVQTKKMLLLH
ncbi:MAG: alpha-amylase family glycosyl hydrolase [Bacteroidota bacterium]